MSFLLVIIGVVLFLICLAGIVLGAYMALDRRSREPGVLFALLWVSGAAGAAGIAMRDGVTFLVGTVCFLVAGTAFVVLGDVRRPSSGRRERETPRGETPEGSEKTTKENRAGYRRAAS